jgi:hypothetical protein
MLTAGTRFFDWITKKLQASTVPVRVPAEFAANARSIDHVKENEDQRATSPHEPAANESCTLKAPLRI